VRNAYKTFVGKPENQSVDQCADGRILTWILKRSWFGLIWLWMGPVAGSCEHGNELSGSVKGWGIY
jgi:hypothetical protein